jgi:multiple sugar transport system substrate-binding protein/raffinose/stachyose/melibiose transport system substrate-binding protein
MRRTGARAAVTSGLVVGAVLLSGCVSSSKSSDTKGGGATGTVRMLVNVTPNLPLTFWRNLVKPFETANPGITVKIEAPGATGVAATLTTDLAASTEPDVVQGATADDIADRLVDLSNQSWASAAPLAAETAVDGKNLTVAIGVQLQSLVFYNKTAFAKAGIASAPKTLDELTADMGLLKKAGYLPMQTAGDAWVTGAQLNMLAAPTLLSADPNWYSDVKAGKTKVSTSLAPVVNAYKKWLD